MSQTANAPNQKYHSADFDKTPPRPRVVMPDKFSHPAVESAGQNDGYSKERKHPVFFVDLPSHAISMTIGWLEPGQSSNRHRHTYETVLYVLEGEGYSDIQGKRIPWKQGDAVYIPVWAWHNHVNTHPTQRARYLACENAPMLQNMGGIALREEVPEKGQKPALAGGEED
ncbi:cupin domain-containing protein [Vitiosangium sp. GDMCC 1.1324]|uniref:cupin domain-containing protein n=1 Tax=Vitiosangium sp. (strain GDMCC 1.1324) TaxID=2138576 RepID=UPI000D3B8CF9|nr:cupin domain-containing protein [Vitiosangium sp. GDMCC 1.1324]PTL79340.1 cupin [Vitiosangium sp. GDMCC 1.1324]